jgi:hypothetical protein
MTFWKGKQDILRHCYGTHRMPVVRNAHQVAEEMGNSVSIVRRHYDAVLEPSKAASWWLILPDRLLNIVQAWHLFALLQPFRQTGRLIPVSPWEDQCHASMGPRLVSRGNPTSMRVAPTVTI